MAQVPVYTPDQVTDLQAPRVPYQGDEAVRTGEAGQLAIARSVGGLAHVAEKVSLEALKVKAEYDRNEVEARLSDIGSRRTELDAQVLKLQGKQALGSKDQALGAYDDATRALESTLSNREQKAMFRDRVREQRMIAERQWWMHEAQQLEVQGEQDFADGRDRRASDSGLTWKVVLPDGRRAFDVLMDDEMKALADRAMAKDWGDERLAREQRHSRARMVSEFVLNAVANPSDYGSQIAREVLLKNSSMGEAKVNEKGEIVIGTAGLMDADVVHKLWTAIHAAGVRDEVRTEFKRILGESKVDAQTGLMNLNEQLTKAREIKNPEVAEHVEGQLRQQWAIDNEIRSHKDALNAAAMNDAMDAAYQRGQPIFVNEADPRWVDMSEIGRSHVRQHATSLISMSRSQRAQMLQEARWYFGSFTPDQQANLNIDRDFAFLPEPHRNALKGEQQKVKAALEQAQGIDVQRIHQLAADAAEPFSFGKDRVRLGRFITHIQAEVTAQFPDKKHPANLTAVNEIIGKHLLLGDSGFWSLNRTWWEAEEKDKTEGWRPSPPEEQKLPANRLGKQRAPPPPAGPPPGTGKVKPIPPEIAADIDAALQRNHQEPNNVNRLKLWLLYPQSREQ